MSFSTLYHSADTGANMNWEDFKVQNWTLMSDKEKSAWLTAFALNITLREDNGIFINDGTGVPLDCVDANLIAAGEAALSPDQKALYISSIMGEVSAQIYEGKTQEQIQAQSTAMEFYSAILMCDLETRGRCMYWAIRGQRA